MGSPPMNPVSPPMPPVSPPMPPVSPPMPPVVPTWQPVAAQYLDYPHYNCYAGHGGSGTAAGIQESLSSCASRGINCFVYFNAQGLCFPRDWCAPQANGCEYGTYGQESWEFTTYIKKEQPTMPPVVPTWQPVPQP